MYICNNDNTVLGIKLFKVRGVWKYNIRKFYTIYNAISFRFIYFELFYFHIYIFKYQYEPIQLAQIESFINAVQIKYYKLHKCSRFQYSDKKNCGNNNVTFPNSLRSPPILLQ